MKRKNVILSAFIYIKYAMIYSFNAACWIRPIALRRGSNSYLYVKQNCTIKEKFEKRKQWLILVTFLVFRFFSKGFIIIISGGFFACLLQTTTNNLELFLKAWRQFFRGRGAVFWDPVSLILAPNMILSFFTNDFGRSGRVGTPDQQCQEHCQD